MERFLRRLGCLEAGLTDAPHYARHEGLVDTVGKAGLLYESQSENVAFALGRSNSGSSAVTAPGPQQHASPLRPSLDGLVVLGIGEHVHLQLLVRHGGGGGWSADSASSGAAKMRGVAVV